LQGGALVCFPVTRAPETGTLYWLNFEPDLSSLGFAVELGKNIWVED
jgi:hypothetical protein